MLITTQKPYHTLWKLPSVYSTTEKAFCKVPETSLQTENSQTVNLRYRNFEPKECQATARDHGGYEKCDRNRWSDRV